MAGLSDHSKTISASFGLIWFSGFRGEDLRKYMTYNRRRPSDCKFSRGLWTGELKQRSTSTENTLVNNKHICRVHVADCFTSCHNDSDIHFEWGKHKRRYLNLCTQCVIQVSS